MPTSTSTSTLVLFSIIATITATLALIAILFSSAVNAQCASTPPATNQNCWSEPDTCTDKQTWEWGFGAGSMQEARAMCDASRAYLPPHYSTNYGTARKVAWVGLRWCNDTHIDGLPPVYDTGNVAADYSSNVDNATRNWQGQSCYVTGDGVATATQVPCELPNSNQSYAVYCERRASPSYNPERWGFYPNPVNQRPIITYTVVALARTRADAQTYCQALGGELAVFTNASQAKRAVETVLSQCLGSSWKVNVDRYAECPSHMADRGIWTGLHSTDGVSWSYENEATYAGFLATGTGHTPINAVSPVIGACYASRFDPVTGEVHATQVACGTTRTFLCSRAVIRAIANLDSDQLEQNQTTKATVKISGVPRMHPLTLYFTTSDAGAVVSDIVYLHFPIGTSVLEKSIYIFAFGQGGSNTKVSIDYDMRSRQFQMWRDAAWNQSSSISVSESAIINNVSSNITLSVKRPIYVTTEPFNLVLIQDQSANVSFTLSVPAPVRFQLAVVSPPDCLIAAPGITFEKDVQVMNVTIIAAQALTCGPLLVEWTPVYLEPWSPTIESAHVNITVIEKLRVRFLFDGILALYDGGIDTPVDAAVTLSQIIPVPSLTVNVYSTNCTWFVNATPNQFVISNAAPTVNVSMWSRRLQTRSMYCAVSLEIQDNISFAIVDPLVVHVRQQAEIVPIYMANVFIIDPETFYYGIHTYWGSDSVNISIDPLLEPYVVTTKMAKMTPINYARTDQDLVCQLPPETIYSPGGLTLIGPDVRMIAPRERQRMLPSMYATVKHSNSGDHYGIQLWSTTYRLDPRGVVRVNTSLSIEWFNGNYPNNNKIQLETVGGCTFSDGSTLKRYKKSALNIGELLIWKEADFIRVPGSTENCSIIASRANAASDIVVHDNTLLYVFQPLDPQIAWTGVLNNTLPNVIPIDTPQNVWVQVDRWPSGPQVKIDIVLTSLDPCVTIRSPTTTQSMTMFEWNPLDVVVEGTCVSATPVCVQATVDAPTWPTYDIGYDGITSQWCFTLNRFLTMVITKEDPGPHFLYPFSGYLRLRYTISGFVASTPAVTITPNASDTFGAPSGAIFTPASANFDFNNPTFLFEMNITAASAPLIWFGWSQTDPGPAYDYVIRGSQLPEAVIFGSFLTLTPPISTMNKNRQVTMAVAASGVTLPGDVVVTFNVSAGLVPIPSVVLNGSTPIIPFTVASDGTAIGRLSVIAQVGSYPSLFASLVLMANVFVRDDSNMFPQYGSGSETDPIAAPHHVFIDQPYPVYVQVQPRTPADDLQVVMQQQQARDAATMPIGGLYWHENTLATSFAMPASVPLNLGFTGVGCHLAIYMNNTFSVTNPPSESTYNFIASTTPPVHNHPKMTPIMYGMRQFFSGAATEEGVGGLFFLVVGPPPVGQVEFSMVVYDIDKDAYIDPTLIFPVSSWIVDANYSGAPIPVAAYSWFSRNITFFVVPSDHTYHLNGTSWFAQVVKKPSGTYTLTETRSKSGPTPSRTDTHSKSRTTTSSVSESATRTGPTKSRTRSQSLTRTVSESGTDSATRTGPTPSRTRSQSLSRTVTASESSSESATRSGPTKSRTVSLSPSRSATTTETLSPSESPSRTFTRSRSTTPSLSPSESQSTTVSESVSETPTRTATPSYTRTRTVSLSASESRSETETRSPSASTTRSTTRSHSLSSTISESISRSATESLTPPPTPSRTETTSKSATATETQSDTGTRTLPPTPSPTESHTKTVTLSHTGSPTASITKTVTPPPTPSPTESHSKTESETDTFTFTRWSPTPVPTRTPTWTGGTPSRSETFHVWDQCSEGWIQLANKCYKYFRIKDHRTNESLPTPMTFSDALRFCGEYGATIVPIQHLAQYKFLQDIVGKSTGRKFWNGVYQDPRYKTRVWRTIYNRSHFDDFFLWDQHRGMPHDEDCVVIHNYGDLSQRIVGGNGAMITYPCDSRAEVICVRQKDPWGVTAVNATQSGRLLYVEGTPLTLSIVGRRLPRLFSVQLQTTHYTTHSGPEGEPTHCSETKPRNPIYFNVSAPAVATNVTQSFRFHTLCNGTCTRAILNFPPNYRLERGKKYSVCFFLPFDFDVPTSSDEYRWDFLPNMWLEVAEARHNYYQETCERHKQLVDIMYFDRNATDLLRPVPSPYYFDGPIQPVGYTHREGYQP